LSGAVRKNKVVISEHVAEPYWPTEDNEGEDFDVPVVNTLLAENVSIRATNSSAARMAYSNALFSQTLSP